MSEGTVPPSVKSYGLRRPSWSWDAALPRLALALHRWIAASGQFSKPTTGKRHENGNAESFFRMLKREEMFLEDHQPFAEAEANLCWFIGAVYNAKRLHSSFV